MRNAGAKIVRAFFLLLIVIFYVLDRPVKLLAVVQRERSRRCVRVGWGVIIFCRFGFVQIRVIGLRS
jgi:hypothetical protein